jgi:hypothetical protein
MGRTTMKALRNTLALMVVALLYQQMCLAQVDPWERVKLIEEGKKVQVKLLSGKTLNGNMAAWNPEGITVRQGKDKVVPVAKSDVAQVAMVSGMSRGRKAAYAGLIAGGITGGITAAECAKYRCVPSAGVVVVVVGAVWAGIAGGIAALFPPHKEVIYTAAASAPGGPAR